MICAHIAYPNSSVHKESVDMNCGVEHDEFTFKIDANTNKVTMLIDSNLLHGTAIYDSASDTYQKTFSYGGYNFRFQYKVISNNIMQWIAVYKTN
ncbi:hypothetical protein EYD45_00505 [Hyunsoonleella flava]|uniref:Uncharacterized protein n=1 Tax=Hyunsoonleella flava TaxID=2527939 RepID=A0A4Q9FGK4_9FLAO|nr:hypothetical protein [Hyunsoonleella flava]TBN06399.1 hypothetical protein EYD45_00505 [Hyunsoonleella flava]